MAYAESYLAEHYTREKNDSKAIQYIRQAIFHAQIYPEFHNYPELLSRLQWQLGKYFKAQNDSTKALSAYRSAVEYLQKTYQYRSLSNSFRDMEEKVYFELADLLLQQAAKTPAGNKKQALLKEAINNIESFKAAEVRNYFQDECVTEFEEKAKTVEEFLSSDPNKKTAIFYPIVLENRVELLLVFHDSHIEQFKTAMSAKDLIKNVENFRKYLPFLENLNAQFKFAQNIYDGLIKPINATLKQKNIDTLIIISHDLLLTIPFAALSDRDSEKYLIEDYAIAIAPGWKLTDPRSFQYNEENKALLIGLSTGVDEKFRKTLPKEIQSSLPSVEEELKKLSEKFKYNDRLENKKFTISKVEKCLTNNAYSLVHFSTHGFFDENDPNKSFLLAYDGKLTVDRLGTLIHTTKFREQPIELLNLNTCLSAFGNKRNALGLSGMAIKTGARSVLGSLWVVTEQVVTGDNKVTPAMDIMGWFYEAITKQKEKSSKAKALQYAQKRWLKEHGNSEKGYDSPFYWAPFVVIGNWQ
jgi:CHAT domain-containing protein